MLSIHQSSSPGSHPGCKGHNTGCLEAVAMEDNGKYRKSARMCPTQIASVEQQKVSWGKHRAGLGYGGYSHAGSVSRRG